jgi:DNA-binding GntR family transcriptional regulator
MRRDGGESLAARLVRLLERAITTGELKAGERLEETVLAERYRVSRTPIREAIRELAACGLVEIRPRRGAVVHTVSPADLAEMFEAMAELEASCALLASRRAGAADFARLEEAQNACRQAAEAADPAAYALGNQRLHCALYAASHNRYLAEVTLKLYRRLEPYRTLLFEFPERRAASVREHEAILKALAGGDGKQAASCVRAHVGILGERFTALVSSLRLADSAEPAAPAMYADAAEARAKGTMPERKPRASAGR